MPRSDDKIVIEVRYISMNKTHLQVEYADPLTGNDEYWIPLSAVDPGFNIFDDIMDLNVKIEALQEIGFPL